MDAVVVTLVGSAAEAEAARLLVSSLRRFGGESGACAVWVFVAGGSAAGDAAAAALDLAPAGPGVETLSLDAPPALLAWPYGAKVLAAARAEARAAARTRSLIWLDPDCLVVGPPVGFDLGDAADAAVRPVHLRGVGQPPGEAPDAFWSRVYAAVDAPRDAARVAPRRAAVDAPRDAARGTPRRAALEDPGRAAGVPSDTTGDARRAATGSGRSGLTVESFVEGETLRPFFNSHGFALRPGLGLCRRWLEAFEELVGDAAFTAAACADELHRVFLFQAVLSAVLDVTVGPSRLRLLPPTYSYPYNLHGRVPAARRATALEDLVSVVYEGRSLRPAEVADVAVGEPLRSWLETVSRGW